MTLPLAPDAAAFAAVGAFVDELARSGVRHVCIAPGSRSTPLALTIARHPALRTWMHLDERCAGFFALGMARTLGAPVALLCTSGTAAANFLPAVVEARSAGIPLLVLTADRPPELRDVGAAQTIDQNRLFGSHVKWFVEVGVPEATPELLRHARALACRAVATAAAAPAGPVHLNFPFREPLVPVAVEPPASLDPGDLLAWRGRPGGAPWVLVDDAPPVASAEVVARLASALRSAQRPLIICGPQPDVALAAPLAELARAIGAPLLADPLSQLRWGTHEREAIIDAYDPALRDGATVDALAPDLVLRIGALPTSKPLLQYLQRHAGARHVVVDAARWPDPALLAAEMVHADPRWLADALRSAATASMAGAGGADPAWLPAWRAVDAATRRALASHAASVGEPFEGAAVAAVAARIPSGGTLFVSSSMPVRDLDAFARGDVRALRVMANRGANGIDGVVSSALGAAAAGREANAGPLVLVIGDIAMYHDMNGLLAAKQHGLDATIVVLNNDGGGIFSFLPQASQAEHFEQLFGTPHGLAFEPAAAMYGARYHRATSHDALGEAVAAATAAGGLHLVELRTDRGRNVALHREAWEAVRAAIAAPRAAGG
ncbi:MAG TPA: 2-succinyl-5-enolpyruvyl-6-hydroxy-3-cyclohexene-1-carboxylic-acid synthase [Gemmatimonadaceae bacterium]